MNGAGSVRPGLLRITLVFLALTSMIHHAQAQTQAQTQQTTLPIPSAPSDADLQNPNSAGVAPRTGLAPQLQPLRSPQDQASYLAAQQAAQQAAQTNTTPQQQQAIAPQLVPVNNTAPQAAMPGQASLQSNSSNTLPPAADTTTTTTTSTTTETEPPKQKAPTTTAGFTTKNPESPDKLPLNTAPVRVTNPGMDMSINPNLVAGQGGVDANGNPVNTVPYEVQLQQRTQEIEVQARDQAFDQAKKSVLPMEGYEIRDVLGRLKDTQEAIQKPVRPPPTPNNVIETISTDPSAVPKTIQLAAGNVTTINIVDITGEPWPIVDLGFGGAFDVKPPEAGGHVIRITPLKDFARGNLVIRLLKMTTPITFTLQSGGDTVNYRFDARIPDYGPNAKMPLTNDGLKTVAGDKTTTAFLEGVPPKGSDKLAVAGVDGRTSAYKYAGTMYVRTPLTLISPSWDGSATSADGMNVYVLSDAPVLLLSDKGALVRARISDAKKEAAGF
jgi:intracellular multiplication protein IcmK